MFEFEFEFEFQFQSAERQHTGPESHITRRGQPGEMGPSRLLRRGGPLSPSGT